MFRAKGFMNYQRKQLSPDLTPLIDVVFLLLIFFMVATSFDEMRGFKINLPTSEISELDNNSIEKISVVVESDRTIKILIEGEKQKIIEAERDNFIEKLTTNLKFSESKRVGILADKNIDYGEIVDIMSEIKLAGAQGIDIEAKGKEIKK